jgi:hypothetical protein
VQKLAGRNNGRVFSKGSRTAAFFLSFLASGCIMLTFSAQTPDAAYSAGSGGEIAGWMLREFMTVIGASAIIYLVCALVGKAVTGRKNIAFGLGLFGISLFQMMSAGAGLEQTGIGSWEGAWYGMDYSLGFGSRMLVGTILKILYPGFLSVSEALQFLRIVLVLTAALAAAAMTTALITAPEKYRTATLVLICVFMFCPGNFASIARDASRFDTFGVLFMLAAILLFLLIRNDPVRYILATVCAILMILAHQGNFFLYYPPVLAMMFMDMTEDAIRLRRFRTVLAVCSVLFVSGIFLYMQLKGTKVMTMDQAQLEAYVQGRTDIPMNSDPVRYEYYSTIGSTYEAINKPFIYNSEGMELPSVRLMLTIAVVSPMLVIWYIFWKGAYECGVQMSGQKGKIKSMMCNPVFYVIMTFCMILPQFILNLDWGRWCRAICIGQTATSLAAVGMGKTWAVAGLEKIRNFIEIAISTHKVVKYRDVFRKKTRKNPEKHHPSAN